MAAGTIAIQEVTRGILNSSLVHPREMFRLAIAYGAAGIIVAHNHPSGDPTPSADDLHGRNYENWFRDNAASHERYYLYSADELKGWLDRIHEPPAQGACTFNRP